MSTEAVVSLRIKDVIYRSVRVGSRPLVGGGSGGSTRRPWCCIPFTSLEQYIPSASTSQLVPEDKEGLTFTSEAGGAEESIEIRRSE